MILAVATSHTSDKAIKSPKEDIRSEPGDKDRRTKYSEQWFKYNYKKKKKKKTCYETIPADKSMQTFIKNISIPLIDNQINL